MLLLHFLDILVIFSHIVVYTFLHSFLYKLLLHSLSNFTKQYPLNIIQKNNIILFSSIAHGFFNVLTARMVNDLNETQNKKPKSTLLKAKSLENFIDTSTNLINHSTDVTSPPPFYTKRPNKIQFPKFNLFPKRHHNSHQKTASLPFSPVQHPPFPNYTHKNFHPNDNLTTQHDTLINNSVTSITDTPIKIYSRINYPFPPPSS